MGTKRTKPENRLPSLGSPQYKKTYIGLNGLSHVTVEVQLEHKKVGQTLVSQIPVFYDEMLHALHQWH